MNQGVRNVVNICVSGAAVSELHDMTLLLKQGSVWRYTPTVVDSQTLQIEIPARDAEKFDSRQIMRMQLVFLDGSGIPWLSDIAQCSVQELLGGSLHAESR